MSGGSTLSSRGTPLAMASNKTVVGRNEKETVDFRQINSYMSKMIEDRDIVTMEDQ